MKQDETVEAVSGGLQGTFSLDWDTFRWTSTAEYEMSDFPFIAEVRGKRYELYGDGTFDEEDLTREEEIATES
jgi:hypothetical protein